MDGPGDEEVAAAHLATLVCAMRPTIGVVGVFGNHDSPRSRAIFRKIAGVHWLENQWLAPSSLALPAGLAVAGLGTACPHDMAPVGVVGDMRADVVFSGHTHGGQCRLPVRWNRLHARALVNSTDWPLHLTSGVMLHRRTLAVVSRGMGETTLRIRAFCPIHLVVVELVRGPAHPHEPHGILNVQPW
jgi:predicted MPP superfamily phosphohydrolase